MEILKYTKDNNKEIIQKACNILKNDGILIYPTETTYGLGVNAKSEKAVKKLLKYKRRREGKALSIAVNSEKMASNYAEINDIAKNLYKNFLPGPLTVISQGLHNVSEGVESETGTIGIRIPKYDLILDIIREFNGPITATSANASYKRRPYKIDDILNNISNKQKDLIDLIIDVGELPHNEPSTIVDTTLNGYSILRQGDIALSNFEEYFSNSEEETHKLATNLLESFKDNIGKKSIIFALQGDMGAGKTQFAKGVAEFLSINRIVSSPTFLLEKEYDFEKDKRRHKLVHIDTWRIFSSEELEELKISEHIKNNNIIVIEWADKIFKDIKKLSLNAIIIWIQFKIIDENKRKILYSFDLIK